MTKTRWTMMAASMVAMAAVAIALPGAASAVTWQQVGPGIPVSATESWGLQANPYGSTAVHWDNGTTTYVPFGQHTILRDVAADPPAGAWAVGSHPSNGIGGNIQPIMTHLSGSSVTAYSLPNDGASEVLVSVAVISSADAWAAGPGVLVHWDGTTWSRMVAPTPAGAAGPLAITSLSATGSDLWALGSASVGGSQAYYAARWDGTSWTFTPALPAVPGFVRFTNLSAASTSTVWVGGVGTGGGFALDYNGSAWSTFTMPGGSTSNVDWVAARSGQAWAVGTVPSPAGGGQTQAAVWTWGGSAWSAVPFPVTTAESSATRVSYVPGSTTVWVNSTGGTYADG